MKVKIGGYINWIGPYQIVDKLFFWVERYPDDAILKNRWDYKLKDNFSEWLASTWVSDFCEWVHSKRSRTIKVHIDRYDTWSADSTLALIILPMLKQLHVQKHGAPLVDDEDAPWYLRSHIYTKENGYDLDPAHFKRWDWIIDEMIWTFEQLVGDDNDWESRYHHGKIDILWGEKENGCCEMLRGPNDTHWWDKDGYMKHQEHIRNGLRLFGKYYQGLWT